MRKYSLSSISKSFDSIYDLVDYVLSNGICPSCEIILNGSKTGEYVQDYMVE